MHIKISNIQYIKPDHTVDTANFFIVDDKIAHIGINAPKDFKSDYLIDGSGKIAVPGFINTHTHAYMSGFRNWADDLSFNDWLFGKIMPAEDKLDPDSAYPLALLSLLEMVQSGCTCFVDMHMFPEASITAANDINMTAFISRGLSGSQSDKAGGDRRIQEAIREIEKYKQYPNIHFMFGPHSVYTCDKVYLKEIASLAQKYNIGIHTHISESTKEVTDCLSTYNASPVKLMRECGLLGKRTIAAHCVHISDDDIRILKKTKTNVSINMCSNLKLGNGIPPVKRLQEAEVNLCLGTDGASSNNALNMLREMQFTSLVPKGDSRDCTAAKAYEVFDMATINAAKALGLKNEIGQLVRGFNADIAIFNLDDLALTPLGDPIAALCYSAAGVKADTVICNGNIVLEHHEFKDIDIDKLKDHVMTTCQNLIYT